MKAKRSLERKGQKKIKDIMSGTQGKSGRLPKDWKEWDIESVVNHSVKLVNRFLNDEEISKEKRLEVAAKFALKIVPEQHIVEQRHTLSHEDRMALRDRLTELLEAKQDIEVINVEVNDGEESDSQDIGQSKQDVEEGEYIPKQEGEGERC